MQCEACGENPTLTEKKFRDFDYEKFTQSPLSVVRIFCVNLLVSISLCKTLLETRIITEVNFLNRKNKIYSPLMYYSASAITIHNAILHLNQT